MLVGQYDELGRILVQDGLVSQDQLDGILNEVRKGNPLRRVLGKYIKPATYSTIMSLASKIPAVDLSDVPIQPAALQLISEEVVRQHNALPYAIDEDTDTLYVAVDDPIVEVASTLTKVSGKSVKLRISVEGLDGVIDRVYQLPP